MGLTKPYLVEPTRPERLSVVIGGVLVFIFALVVLPTVIQQLNPSNLKEIVFALLPLGIPAAGLLWKPGRRQSMAWMHQWMYQRRYLPPNGGRSLRRWRSGSEGGNR